MGDWLFDHMGAVIVFVTVFVFAFILFAALSSDGPAKPISSAPSSNEQVQSDVIAQVDGCTVYRLKDGDSRTVYFMRCPNAVVKGDARHYTSCGKGCVQVHYDETETLTERIAK